MIKIEVTGNSIPEVADKLLAIGASLRASAPNKVEFEKGDRPIDRTIPFSALKSAPVAEATESQPTTTEPSSTPAPAASASEDEELEVVDLPVVNLRDLVLSVVEKRGKPVMEEILTRFGVAKASMVSPELLPELIGLCNEALAK
jgi:hypothetical protein